MFIIYKLFEFFSFIIKRSRFYFFNTFFPLINRFYFPNVTIFSDIKNEKKYFSSGIGAQTQKTEKALKKGILGLTKNFTDLADLAIAEYDEADLSPQVSQMIKKMSDVHKEKKTKVILIYHYRFLNSI